MATITPTVTRTASNGSVVVTWANMATGDTINAVDLRVHGVPALLGSCQISGTFGGATITLTASNDASTYIAIKDTQGTAISATADAWFEISTAAQLLKPTISGGTGDSVSFTLGIWVGEDFR